MDLPVEVLEPIFMLACVDGGFTGCSLSRVSKFVRLVSRSSRFTSIALTSRKAEHLAQFLSYVGSQCAAVEGQPAPVIKRLYFVSAKRRKTLKGSNPDRERAKYHADVSALFRLVAPTLYSLVLLHGHRKSEEDLGIPDIKVATYPCLHELHIFGSEAEFLHVRRPSNQVEPGAPAATGREYASGLPSLKRLHLVPAGQVRLDVWAACAPGITHLRLSHVNHQSGGLYYELFRLLGEYIVHSTQ